MLLDEIKKNIHGDISYDDNILEENSRDYSIFKIRPKVVVFPKDVEDIKKLVKFASKNEISLTGRSAGTDMTGGPLTDSVVVSFTRYFNKIEEISNTSFDEGHVVVQPGVYFRDLEKELDKRGMMYPAYTASKDLCALGGMVSNNSGGEKTLAYGKTEKYVEALKVVLSDGEEHIIKPLSKKELEQKIKKNDFEGNLFKKIYKLIETNKKEIKEARPDVSKNSSGYALWNIWDGKKFDLTKLFVGSQGTLGLITEAKLRIVKKKRYSRMAVIFLKDLNLLPDIIVEILKFKPESLESYDNKTMNLALKFFPKIFKSIGGSFFKLAWQFMPEVMMAIKGGLPKIVLLASFSEDKKSQLDNEIGSLVEDIKKSFGNKLQIRELKNEEEAKKYTTIRQQSFKLLHDNLTGLDTAPFIDDFIVKPEYLSVVLPKINSILKEYGNKLIYTIAGHPGNGNFHIIPLMDLKNPEIRAIIPEISKRVYDVVLENKGSITAEHNDGLIRTPYLEKMYGKKMVKIFEEVKKIMDPNGIFNPRKKTGGSMKYSLSKITSRF